ncbi:MAG: hypothetical protein ACOYNI_12695 [Acidimicrobiia bacterium]
MLTDAILHRALRRDEQVRWTGEPRVGVFTDRRDKFFVPASLVLLLVTSWVTLTAFTDGSFFDFWISAPLLLLALHLSVGRIALRMDRRRRITYAVTNLRVLMAIDGTTLHVQSIALGRISELDITTDDASETATVRFAPTNALVRFLESTGIAPLGLLGPAVAFVDVTNADRIPAVIPHATVAAPKAAVVDEPVASAAADEPAASAAAAEPEIDLTQDFAARFEQLRRERAS